MQLMLYIMFFPYCNSSWMEEKNDSCTIQVDVKIGSGSDQHYDSNVHLFAEELSFIQATLSPG